jgi:ABC-type Fe3+-hydroxamate transport system substrate-binding protein
MSLSAATARPRAPRAITPAILAVAVLLSAGAAVGITAGYFALRPGPTSTPPGALTLTDDLGRNVTVPYDPARVVVFGASIMDTVYRLGLRSHVVGVDCYLASAGGLTADYSNDQIASWGLDQSMCVTIGPSFDIESLLNRTPQLVLASTIVSVQAVEMMSDTYHIPVVMIQPPTVGGILTDVSLVGRIFGVGNPAASIDNALTAALDNSSSLISGYADNNSTVLPSVLVTYDANPGGGYYSFGPGTFGESMIELAAATSICANASTPYPIVSGEVVLVDDPTYIVYGTGFGLNESSYAVGQFWGQFGAVRNGHAVGLDSNWLTEPDPTMVLVGLPALIATLHPGA